MRKIYLLDTTLRDGEQSPGTNFNLHEKLQIAHQLALLGVDIIEAGFPAASEGDFESVKAIAQAVKGKEIAALSRCILSEVEHTFDAIRYAREPRIHVFVATSDIHLEHKLKASREQIKERICQCVRKARELCESVQFSCEDASRSDIGFLAECCQIAVDEGASTIGLPDTVGYAAPDEHARMFREVIGRLKNTGNVRFSAHCHNDLGMAVANSIAAIGAGADQVDCVIGGIGERAGNAALEEIVMALKTRGEHFGAYTDVDTTQIKRSAVIVSHYSGINLAANKPVVGENVFRHESGIHQHGVLSNPLTYEIMRPEDVGVTSNNLVLGKHSGMHAFADHMNGLGYWLAEDEMQRAFRRFKSLSDKKKVILDDDLIAIANENTSAIPQEYELEYFNVVTGINIVPTASVRLTHGGKRLQAAACGEGPVDAAFKAVEAAIGCDIELKGFSLKAVTSGKDALGEVTVRISVDGRMSVGKGISTDIIESSVRGLIAAINKHIYSFRPKEERQYAQG